MLSDSALFVVSREPSSAEGVASLERWALLVRRALLADVAVLTQGGEEGARLLARSGPVEPAWEDALPAWLVRLITAVHTTGRPLGISDARKLGDGVPWAGGALIAPLPRSNLCLALLY
ncbi:MAG TPA: hypothetical protein VFH51_04115, partial [Myxococcota bacterium]|nr:hypothetical protein [Myxococcota bacterium]